MNIAGVNLAAATIPGIVTEAGALPVSVDAGLTEGFTSALIAQLGMLNEVNSQAETLQASPASTLSASEIQAGVAGESSGAVANRQDLAALVGNQLPMSYKIDAQTDSDAHLAAVTDAINYLNADNKTADQTEQLTAAADAEAGNTHALEIASQLVIEQKINVDEPVSEADNLVLQTGAQTQPDEAALASDEQKQQQQADSLHADAVTDKANDSAEALAMAAGMVMPAVAAAPPVQTTSDSKPVASESAKVTVVKTSTNEIGKDGDGLLTKANTLQQPAAEGQHFQWQALSEQKPGDDQQDPLSMTATEDGSVSRSALDMAKLDKLAVNKDDVPAISKPLTHPDWNKEIGERILWMNNKAIPAAEIKLNPQHLGPITVRIDVSNQDQASVSFSAQHGVVRDALEAALPKLREMMSAQNLNLVDVSVAQHSSSNQGQSQAQNFAQTAKQQDHSGPVNPADEAGVLSEELDTGKARVSKGLLSMYA